MTNYDSIVSGKIASVLRKAIRIPKGTLDGMRIRSAYKPVSSDYYAGLFSDGRPLWQPGKSLYHGGAKGLTIDSINPMNIGVKQARRISATYGGFYTSPDANFASRFGDVHKIDVSPSARVLHTNQPTTRLSINARKVLSRKYDMIAGRDIGSGGPPEYIILNKGVIGGVSPMYKNSSLAMWENITFTSAADEYINKEAVDINTLVKIPKAMPVFKHPLTRFANRFGLNKYLHPFRRQMSEGGAFTLPVGKQRGLHFYEQPYKTIERLGKMPPPPKEAIKGVNAIVGAHEAKEFNMANKALPKRLYNAIDPNIDVSSFKSTGTFLSNISKPIVNSAKKLTNYVKGSLVKTPKLRANKDYSKWSVGSTRARATRPSDIAKTPEYPSQIIPSEAQVSRIYAANNKLSRHAFASHLHPDVILQEGNMVSTLTGPGAGKASDYMRTLRTKTMEKPIIDAMAKDLGIKNYDWGTTRISRHGRKKISNGLLDTFKDGTKAREFINRHNIILPQ